MGNKEFSGLMKEGGGGRGRKKRLVLLKSGKKGGVRKVLTLKLGAWGRESLG